MKIKALKIGELIAKKPIVLGGMGIGVTGAKLASAITREGGIGVLSGVNIGFKEKDFDSNWLDANIRALKREISSAKENCANGIIGVNFMVAMNHYQDHVKAAIEAGVDIIVSGAGLPLELPKFVEGTKTKIIPIVSSSKAAKVITKMWDKNYHRLPDAIIIEGIKAGGHLGFKPKQLEENSFDIIQTLKDVKKVIAPFEASYNQSIPVIVGGGVFTRDDFETLLNEGADGVQMSTRFVATEECDANIAFKNSYVNAGKEDVQIIVSPVGLPGRALNNPFVQKVNKGNRPPIKRCHNCLQTCNPKTTPYCISQALINAVSGNVDEGLIFVGENVPKIEKITTTHDIFEDLLGDDSN